jgi:hypothetical protein
MLNNKFVPIAERINRQIILDTLGDNATGFFIRQLTEIEALLYETLYKPLKGLQLFETSPKYNAGTENVLYNIVDYVGKAKIIANDPVDDFPTAGVKLAQKIAKIASVGDSYDYSVNDLRAAAMANQSLDTLKAQAARTAIEQAINELIWAGYPEANIYGVLNNPDVPLGSVPADGSGGSTKFIDKTPVQILRDMSAAVREIFTFSGGVHSATNLVLPPNQFEYIKQTPYATAFLGTSILAYFQQNNPDVKVDFANELVGVGDTGEDYMVAFTDNSVVKVSEILLPIPFEQFPPQLVGLKYKVFCHARCGGVAMHYPKAFNIKEGI